MSDQDSKIIDLKAAVEQRKREEELAISEKTTPEDSALTAKKIRQCLQAEEMGDGTLFAHLHRGKFLYNKSRKEDGWLVWRGHHWEYDTMDERYMAVEEVAKTYLKAASEVPPDKEGDKTNENLRKEYYKRVKKLRKIPGATACINYSHLIEDSLAIKGDELDVNPWLIACKNGVLDLRTGKLRDGRPGDYLLKYVPHEWKGIDAPCPAFINFLESALDGSPDSSPEERSKYRSDLISFVRRALGYGMTGLSTEHIFLVFNGAGRNGKGVLVETLRYVLGSVAGPIPAEMLLDQGRAATPSGPTPHIMALKGLRIAFASETDEGRRFSPGQVKWYSGGDTLKGRDLNAKNYIDFEPTHLLILLTNNLPHAPGDDFAFWQRLKLIPFLYSFVAHPDPDKPNQKQRDDQLREKLKSEASGILAWLVRGCLEWQTQGLRPPEMVTTATEDYRLGEDTITQFVDDCCTLGPDNYTNATDLYNLFKRWYKVNISGKPGSCPAQKKFGAMLGKQYKKDKVGGTTRYFGITLREGIEHHYPDEKGPGR
ncbi:MAG: DNA primase [Desulfobulbaceae bacterium]|nr:DNA primase [Desulfobulbaceae bacterium]